MNSSRPSLLHERQVLKEYVLPRYDRTPLRPATMWAIGSGEDAVAMSWALREANLDFRARVFLTTDGDASSRITFGSKDIELFDSDLLGEFEYRDHRWQPGRTLTDQVLMSEPDVPPDFAVVRASPRPSVATRRYELLSRLRQGGLVFFINGVPDSFAGDDAFRSVSADPRLLEKTTVPECPPPAAGEPDTLTSWAWRRELVRSHLPLAKSLARRYAHRGEPVEDLVQVAQLALVRAAERFRTDQGTSFSTFATASVLGELKRHFRDKTWTIRVPRSLQERYLAVKQARDELGHRLGRSPTPDQIANHLGITSELVLEAMEASYSYTPVSLDAPTRDDDEAAELPTTESGYEAALNRAWLQSALPTLDEEERFVIRRLYFDGVTQRAVGEQLRVSQMQVSRIHARALHRLRQGAGTLAIN